MKIKSENNKLWGGAFEKAPSDLVLEFTSGRDVKGLPPAEEVLIPYDIKTNKAHAKMLNTQGIISKTEYKQLDKALDDLLELYEKGEFKVDPKLEDCHTNIEAFLIDKLGIEIGGKIHTARSRNDQAISDTFLYLHDNLDEFINKIKKLNVQIEKTAGDHTDTLCPGFTHHQHATVTSFGVILDSFKIAFERDIEFLKSIKKIFDYSPLGAVTAYGTTFNLNPKITANELGFSKPFENSIDVVTNKGEFDQSVAFGLVRFLDHASKLSQLLILFSTKEFGFLEVADEYSTGSSIMPQKKNPDTLEVTKAKAAYAIGQLTGLLSISKDGMIGYNRDFQWIKYLIIDLINEAEFVPEILAGVIKTLTIKTEKMYEYCSKGFVTSTGLMELIIQNKNISMRQAKKLIELAVKFSIQSGNSDQITYEALQQAITEADLDIIVLESELEKWQDPQYQYNLVKKK